MKKSEFLKEFLENDAASINGDLFLESTTAIAARQKEWVEEDDYKNFNFLSARFWLTTATCDAPVGFESLEDFMKVAKEESWFEEEEEV